MKRREKKKDQKKEKTISKKIQRNLELFERAKERILLEEKLIRALYDFSSFIE